MWICCLITDFSADDHLLMVFLLTKNWTCFTFRPNKHDNPALSSSIMFYSPGSMSDRTRPTRYQSVAGSSELPSPPPSHRPAASTAHRTCELPKIIKTSDVLKKVTISGNWWLAAFLVLISPPDSFGDGGRLVQPRRLAHRPQERDSPAYGGDEVDADADGVAIWELAEGPGYLAVRHGGGAPRHSGGRVKLKNDRVWSEIRGGEKGIMVHDKTERTSSEAKGAVHVSKWVGHQ